VRCCRTTRHFKEALLLWEQLPSLGTIGNAREEARGRYFEDVFSRRAGWVARVVPRMALSTSLLSSLPFL
jgi:hypothetical protein